MPAFEYDDLLPCLGKIRCVNQAVVASADDDNVVVQTHSYDSAITQKKKENLRDKDCTFY